jgi:hypothetical protein
MAEKSPPPPTPTPPPTPKPGLIKFKQYNC